MCVIVSMCTIITFISLHSFTYLCIYSIRRYYNYYYKQMIQVQLLLVQKENEGYQDSQVPLAILEYQDYVVKMEFQE